jgi:hypothetical protein
MQFEYKIFSQMSKTTRFGQSIDWSAAEKTLNELVAEGWELVSSNASAIGLMVFGCGSVEPGKMVSLHLFSNGLRNCRLKDANALAILNSFPTPLWGCSPGETGFRWIIRLRNRISWTGVPKPTFG